MKIFEQTFTEQYSIAAMLLVFAGIIALVWFYAWLFLKYAFKRTGKEAYICYPKKGGKENTPGEKEAA